MPIHFAALCSSITFRHSQQTPREPAESEPGRTGVVAILLGRVAQVHFCSFLMTASTDERIPLLQYTGTLRNEDAPRVRFYAWGFVSCQRHRTFRPSGRPLAPPAA